MSDRPGSAAPLFRALIALVLSASYFAYVFRLPAGTVFNTGMGDWLDPYFINYLLEHWFHSVRGLTRPVSPPMYFPARGTLGYSHGLVLFAPFYIAVRTFLHPFLAYNATMFLVLITGTICLYVTVRTFMRLGFVESLLVTAFFASSANVINEPAGIWAQRLSVFLIPPVVLAVLIAAHVRHRRWRLALGWLSGLWGALLFIQDFYTAAFAVLVSGLFLAGTLPLLDARALGWWKRHRPYLLALGLGAAAGGVVFVVIYLRAYREHPVFPENQLNNALTLITLSRAGFARGLRAYETLRSFELVFAAAVLAWIPWFHIDRKTRLCALWFALVSLMVLAIPLRIGPDEFSVWKRLFAPLPGLSSIRDPKRVIEGYELAAAFLAALFLARLPWRSTVRVSFALIMCVLIVTNWNRNQFNFSRPIEAYARWVEPPIRIDSTCESFFIMGASDVYMSRASNQWGLYAMDAMFISLRSSIPTLNGYSAWWPDGWRLSNPQRPEYAADVDAWIAQNGLRNVCALDIDARTMTRH